MGNVVKRNSVKKNQQNTNDDETELFKFKQNSQNGYLLVMRFIRQNIEKDLKILIPMEIKDIIYKFWGNWINIKVGDIIQVKGSGKKWYDGIIKYYKRSNEKGPDAFDIPGLTNRNLKKMTLISEGIVVQPYSKINLKWKQIKVGYKIDARDKFGEWYIAKIIYHKKTTEKIPKHLKLSDNQKSEKTIINGLEGIYVDYVSWQEKYNEWIFIRDNTFCECDGNVCITDKTEHRIAAPYTKSKKTNCEFISFGENAVCFCESLCDTKEHHFSIR